jgi:hypothetical protein
METTTITAPDTTELAKLSTSLVEMAEGLVVDSPESREVAGTGVRQLKGLRKQIVTLFAQSKTLANQAHKAIVAACNTLDAAPKRAEAVLNKKLDDYEQAEERKRKADEDRLRELARKEAEDRQLKEAVAAEAAGDTEAAAEIIAEPIAAPVVMVAPTLPKLAGVSTREHWKHRVVDDAKIPRDYMMPDDKKIGAYARSMQSKAVMNGVEFYSDTSRSARSH